MLERYFFEIQLMRKKFYLLKKIGSSVTLPLSALFN